VLITVVLIQEGKGGGLGDAFGGQAQQTFGVGAKGINRFTSYVAIAFLGCAVTIHILHRKQIGASVVDGTSVDSPVEALPDAGSTAPPADGE
jgi:protein translocase SecG subunit